MQEENLNRDVISESSDKHIQAMKKIKHVNFYFKLIFLNIIIFIIGMALLLSIGSSDGFGSVGLVFFLFIAQSVVSLVAIAVYEFTH